VLTEEFTPPLRRRDKETIKRLSGAYRLLELLEMMKANISIKGSQSSGRPLKMEIAVRGVYAEELLARAISTAREDLRIDVDYSVIKERKLAPMELQS